MSKKIEVLKRLNIDEIMEEMEEKLKIEKSEQKATSSKQSVSEEVDAKMFGLPSVSFSRRRSSGGSQGSPKPGKIFKSTHTNEKYYDMSNAEIGRALIFNQRDIEGQKTRQGTIKDATDLEKVLWSFGFTVSVFKDYKYKQIMAVLEAISEENHSNRDCLVVVILSHGTANGRIFASDGEFDVEEMWTPFVGENCPTLIGKPKLFFVQACKGKLADPGVLMRVKQKPKQLPTGDSVDAEVCHVTETVHVIPSLADLLVMYSTSEGHISFRNPENGSFFIQALCKELQESSNEDLLIILTGVIRRVAFGCQSTVPGNEIYDAAKQMPCFISMLTKTFYLRKRNNFLN